MRPIPACADELEPVRDQPSPPPASPQPEEADLETEADAMDTDVGDEKVPSVVLAHIADGVAPSMEGVRCPLIAVP